MKLLIFFALLLSVSAAISAQPEESGTPPAASQSRIDINTATVASLQTDLGLSATEAQAVVDYRAKKGLFKSEAQLRKVPGLRPDTLEKLEGRVMFSMPIPDTGALQPDRPARPG